MYINISYKFHRIPDRQTRFITKVHDLLGQPSYVVAENETKKKQIINVQTKSKLCSKPKNGSCIECQHSGECFANIDMASNIGNEEEWAKT